MGTTAVSSQRRWWYWDPDASRKNWDKPAICYSEHVWIKQQVPCVMLESVPGIGKKGQIVHLKRGYARHVLVPKGQAVFGTWENIDMYADPALVEDPSMKARVASARGRLPFDWVDELKVRFVRWAREDEADVLLEPINQWDLLRELSDRYELDLLPGNLDFPDGGISTTGM